MKEIDPWTEYIDILHYERTEVRCPECHQLVLVLVHETVAKRSDTFIIEQQGPCGHCRAEGEKSD